MPLNENAILASSLGEKNEYELSQKWGSLALIEQDERARSQAAISLQVIAFSLYGSEPLYGEGAVLNAQAIKKLLPHWCMRVYHDSSISSHLVQRLQQAGAQTISVNDTAIAHWPGTFWRFHAVSDPRVERVLFRDADSLISEREVSLIEEWLQSSYPFHVMRDWYTHVELILAGLWGAHAPYLAHMPHWVEHYLAHEIEHCTHDDQLFLAQYIWPRIHRHTLVHDSVHPVLGAKDIAMPREHFDISSVLGGYGAVSFPVTLTPPLPMGTYSVVISNVVSGEEICRYQRTAYNGVDHFRIPSYHHRMIESGQWKIDVVSVSS